MGSGTGATRVIEPREVLVMREYGGELRKRGWPVELLVDYVAEKDTYAVSLRFELPPIPALSRTSGTERSS